MVYLFYIVYSMLGTWLLWVFYLAVMNLSRARDAGTLTKPAYIVGYPVLALGLLLDLLVNILVISILMLEFPKESTVTSRLRRLKHAGGWRAKWSNWLAVNILDPFDPSGVHI